MVDDIKISFLIPTLGYREVELQRLFKSLQQQSCKNFEAVIVVQDNFNNMKKLCYDNMELFPISYIESKEKGLSKARNTGLPHCKGDIIILSDDDCWYQDYAVEKIIDIFHNQDPDVLLTQIFDPISNQLYKQYDAKACDVRSKFGLMSRSSIEVALKKEFASNKFDEKFGLGAEFVCGEEIDFLIRLLSKGARCKYIPLVTVFHKRKAKQSSAKQIEAKGAIYSKNYNILVALLICFRDLIIKRENNFNLFFKGYYEYKKRKN